MKLTLLEGEYNVHRLSPQVPIPDLSQQQFYNIVQTAEELSVVCIDSIRIDADQTEKHWRIIKVAGPLEFNMTGVIFKISKILAEASISIFVISTFDTDYVMVKNEKIKAAMLALEKENYQFG
jgi:hypothetical protein